MLPENAMDNQNNNNQRPYAIAKLEEAARIIKQGINELPLIRKRLDRYKDNKPKAREVYTDLQQQHGRLLGALGTSALAMLEIEQSDMADFSIKRKFTIRKVKLFISVLVGIFTA